MKKVIAVSSAKGGVGKSTIAGRLLAPNSHNLILSLHDSKSRPQLCAQRLQDRHTGHGHLRSLDTHLAESLRRATIICQLVRSLKPPSKLHLTISVDNQLLPLSNYGLKSMSMGYLIPESSPVAWRGMMVMKALQQLLHEVDWGSLDVLVLDMPPGTGDVQLTITQQLILDGAIIVSTPQDLSLKDAVKGVELFRKVNVNLLGLVCNMAGFKCPGCGDIHEVFGNMGKIRTMCEKYDLKMLGELPLHGRISDDADKGKPTVVAQPDGEHARVFAKIAEDVEALIGLTK